MSSSDTTTSSATTSSTTPSSVTTLNRCSEKIETLLLTDILSPSIYKVVSNIHPILKRVIVLAKKNSSGFYHAEEGPAIHGKTISIYMKNGEVNESSTSPSIICTPNGFIRYEIFVNNGNVDNKNASAIRVYRNGILSGERWYRNGLTHRDGDLPAIYFHPGTSDFVRYQIYVKDDIPHRENGPAIVVTRKEPDHHNDEHDDEHDDEEEEITYKINYFDPLSIRFGPNDENAINNVSSMVVWMNNGKYHRQNGPAIYVKWENNETLYQYYEHGVRYLVDMGEDL
jgi:hypothetical protein